MRPPPDPLRPQKALQAQDLGNFKIVLQNLQEITRMLKGSDLSLGLRLSLRLRL